MLRRFIAARRQAALLALIAGVASIATMTGLAVAKSFTLSVAHRATVTRAGQSTVREDIAVNSSGRAVYTLSGDSATHPECTKASGCFAFWPPVTVRSAKGLTKSSEISGKLGVLRRNGFIQLTLNRHPLYTFASDHAKSAANGDGLHGFGGTWHVDKLSAATAVAGMPATTTTPTTTPMTPATTTPTTTTPTTTTPAPTCLYGVCY
jgi:predicted lipoprotein with Yx(FWY)xxD motif